ncbi:MAG: hypothetical protein ABW223_04235, partial [Rariglobus sp.]
MKTLKVPSIYSVASALSVAVVSFSVVVAPMAQAADYTFNTVGGTGSTPSLWSTSSWGPSTPVSNLDNVLNFTAPSAQRMISTNDLGAGFQLNALNLTNNTNNSNGQNLIIAGSSL